MEQTPPPLGHNHPPLSIEEFLSAEDAPTDAEVLDALLKRWIGLHPEIAALTERAEKLAGNRERLPAELDDKTVEVALDLIAALDGHEQACTAPVSALPGTLKQAAGRASDVVKNMSKGLEPLEKSLRALISDWLLRDLDARNASSAEKVNTAMKLGRSGARAAITLEQTAIIENPALLPNEWLVPDIKRIEKAIAGGTTIPGVRAERKPALRITWPGRSTAESC